MCILFRYEDLACLLGEACPGMVSHRDWASRSTPREAGGREMRSHGFFCRFGILPAIPAMLKSGTEETPDAHSEQGSATIGI